MKKTFVKDIHENDTVSSVFLVTRKTLITNKVRPFVAMMLRDKTGDLDARIWENAVAMADRFEREDFVRVEGTVVLFQGRQQLTVTSIEKVDRSEIDAADFVAPPKCAPGDRAIAQIVELVERVQDPHLKALAQSFLDDKALMEAMRQASAARSIHHCLPGGLANHTLSVMRLAARLAEHYPMADGDLLLMGAMLHDIGKLRELTVSRQPEYTDEGRLLGHLVIGAQMIHERCAAIPDFPKDLETHLVHIILSHHGAYQFGSPRLPQTLEAILVHHLDDMDSKVGELMEIYQRDPADNEGWTDYQKKHGRHYFKGPSPTVHAKVPFERRKRRALERKAEKERHAAQANVNAKGAAEAKVKEDAVEKAKSAPVETAHAAENAPAKPLTEAKGALETHGQPKEKERHASGNAAAGNRRERREPERKSGGKTLSFKPFEALAAALSERDPQEALDAVKSAVDAVAQTVEAAVESAVKAISTDAGEDRAEKSEGAEQVAGQVSDDAAGACAEASVAPEGASDAETAASAGASEESAGV